MKLQLSILLIITSLFSCKDISVNDTCAVSNVQCGTSYVNKETPDVDVLLEGTEKKPIIPLVFHITEGFQGDWVYYIQRSMIILNNENTFHDRIQFEYRITLNNESTIPMSWLTDERVSLEDEVFPHTDNTALHIYMIHADNNVGGFTYVPRTQYQVTQTEYNYIVIGDNTVPEDHSLVHEVGHFLGLEHKFKQVGNEPNICSNNMNYNYCKTQFTIAQVDTMFSFSAIRSNHYSSL